MAIRTAAQKSAQRKASLASAAKRRKRTGTMPDKKVRITRGEFAGGTKTLETSRSKNLKNKLGAREDTGMQGRWKNSKLHPGGMGSLQWLRSEAKAYGEPATPRAKRAAKLGAKVSNKTNTRRQRAARRRRK